MGVTRKILRGENLWKEYHTGEKIVLQVLKGVDIEIKEGEVVVIVGPSGCGKSTLLHLLGGLDRPTQGKVFFDEKEIFAFPEEELAEFRNKSLGFVFQFHHLLPEFTSLENVCMPALIAGKAKKSVFAKAEKILLDVGLEGRLHHRPNQLSGGEQQRVAVARALMNDPQIVLADEPSGNLDEESGLNLHKLLISLSEKRDLTFVIATHNPDLTKRAHRVLRLTEGKLTTGKSQ